MAVGFYCTVMREASPSRKVGFLLGPYSSETEARSQIPNARQRASEIDPFCDFDFFGTARLERDVLPSGVLNARLEERA